MVINVVYLLEKVSAETFREQRNFLKGCPIFPDRKFQKEIPVPFLQKHFVTSFVPSRSFFGKWN